MSGAGKAFFDAIDQAKRGMSRRPPIIDEPDECDGDGARLAPVMPPVTTLGHYVNMRIIAVTELGDSIVLEVGPIGRMSRRRVLIEGATAVTDITDDRRWSDGDDAQAQIDIGDDIYEREREDRE